MKKFFILLPALICGAFLTGCVDQGAPAPTYGGPAYYGDPYYVNGGVQYYYVGGRYFYYRNNQRFYVHDLPSGGTYWHGHGNYHGNNNSNRNVNVNVNRNVNVNKNINVRGQKPKGGKPHYKKGDKNNDHH